MVEKHLATLTLTHDMRLAPAVYDLVKGICESQGISGGDSGQIAKLTRGILERLFRINLDQSGPTPIIISLGIQSGEFFIAIEHKGLPIELRGDNSGDVSPFSLSINSPVVDEVKLINLGKSGQRLELIKSLPSKIYDERDGDLLESGQTEEDSRLENVEDLEIRMIRSDEGLKLARCFYRVYGYTYGPNYVYFPERLKSLIESGRLVSAGAVDRRGEIVAHGAMRLESRETQIGELISLAVDPKYRSAGLAAKIHRRLVDYAETVGLKGVFAEAVTIHPYSQRLCRALGGIESAVMLGYIPPSDYKRIVEDGFRQRQLAILYFFNFESLAQIAEIFAPMNYWDIIRKIYTRLGLPREFGVETAVPWGVMCGETAFRLTVNSEIGIASIMVDSYCPDTVKIIDFRLRQLIREGIEYIYLDMPLSDPLTPYFAQEFELIGFFFSGVIPFLAKGDALRLQFLNTKEVNFDGAVIDSEFGRELCNYVISKRPDVLV